ncbi:DNA-binding IclR family transcriptional regulator [Variovorax paradoxus]|uniref:DNA-binding IclR family transcriptional regulator n=1 Tax=Variovorax paradoxus TaxID=34073 RepID=A0AAW8E8V0_VARPD|nr:IclR family transcriptional regulator [Variovorax paradoxus]MDP9968972.1 DNA-binding IclR family transcriptional regulator [Variovorax paradoxus]
MAVAVEGGAILDRATKIIDFIVSTDRPVTVQEIVDAVQLPRPTVHRICGTLQSMGLLARDVTPNRLGVGPALTRLSVAALASTGSALPRRAILRRVVDEVQETVTLTVLDHDELLFLDRVESPNPLRLQLFSGSRTPLHCTSAGKLFLAMQPAAQRRTWLANCSLHRYTGNTITNTDALEKELTRIRATKVSEDSQEYIEGLVALAVPILDVRGRMIAAVSVNGPSTRLRMERRDQYVEALRRAARELRSCLTDTASEVGAPTADDSTLTASIGLELLQPAQ